MLTHHWNIRSTSFQIRHETQNSIALSVNSTKYKESTYSSTVLSVSFLMGVLSSGFPLSVTDTPSDAICNFSSILKKIFFKNSAQTFPKENSYLWNFFLFFSIPRASQASTLAVPFPSLWWPFDRRLLNQTKAFKRKILVRISFYKHSKDFLKRIPVTLCPFVPAYLSARPYVYLGVPTSELQKLHDEIR